MIIENVSWESEGVTIRGEIYSPGKPTHFYPALVICHGIPGKTKVAEDGGYPLLAERFCRAGFLALIFNFRGTGVSGGNFDILGWARDLEAGLNVLGARPDIDPKRIFLLGFSGGAAVSIYVAARNGNIAGVVACASPAEFRRLVGEKGMESFIENAREVGIIRDKDFPSSVEEWAGNFSLVRPLDWIGQIPPRPLLIVHGTHDEVVDVSQAHALYSRVNGRAELFLIEGGEHRLRVDERAMGKVLAWSKEKAFKDAAG